VTTVEDLLAAARERLERVTPAQAWQDVCRGAVLVDIRPAAQRREHGEIPGSVIVERNHLEWRFDPASEARLPLVTGHGQRIVVFCQQGYTSSLAAAALRDLGFDRATDLIGGFEAWVDAGLPWAAGGAAGVQIAPGASAARLG
jgi:rhodanese-related sulfurtransferase